MIILFVLYVLSVLFAVGTWVFGGIHGVGRLHVSPSAESLFWVASMFIPGFNLIVSWFMWEMIRKELGTKSTYPVE